MSQKCALAQEIRLGSPDRAAPFLDLLVRGWGLGTRLNKVNPTWTSVNRIPHAHGTTARANQWA